MTKAVAGALALLLIGSTAVEATAQEGPLAYRKGAPGWQERQAAQDAPRAQEPAQARPAPEAPRAREPRDDRAGEDRGRDRGDRDHRDRRRDQGHHDDRDRRERGERRWERGDHRDWERRRPRYDRRSYPPYWTSPNRYRISPYRPPVGFYSRSWVFGDVLPRGWWGSSYRLADWWAYGLPIPPIGFEWVRVGDDALLVDAYSGQVVQVVRHLFW